MKPPQANSQAWEAAALLVLELAGRPKPPIDALSLAIDLGLRIVPSTTPSAMLADDTIYLSPRMPPRLLRACVAHELGHWALRRVGTPDSEVAADRVGDALVLPRYAFDPEPSGWHLGELELEHPFVTREALARRILALQSACLAIWQNGRVVDRDTSPDVSESLLRPTTVELELARAARRAGGVFRRAPRLVGAVDEGNPRRVITICDPRELIHAHDVLTPAERLARIAG